MNIECALSGVMPRPEDFVEDEEGAELPLNWAQISIQRRVRNPEWEELQEAKSGAIEAYKAQLKQVQPKASPEHLQSSASLQARLQFAALEAATPRYIMQEAAVWVAPDTVAPGTEAQLAKLLEPLGLIIEHSE